MKSGCISNYKLQEGKRPNYKFGRTRDSKGTQRGNQTFAPNAGVLGKGVYVPKITLTYGFSVKNGTMTVNPVRVVSPSSFHRQTINQIK